MFNIFYREMSSIFHMADVDYYRSSTLIKYEMFSYVNTFIFYFIFPFWLPHRIFGTFYAHDIDPVRTLNSLFSDSSKIDHLGHHIDRNIER